MSEFVKKTMMGYREVPGGYTDQECSPVILTKKEYDQQLREISAAKQEALNARYHADRDIQRIESQAKRQIAAAESAASQKVAALETALAAEQKKVHCSGD